MSVFEDLRPEAYPYTFSGQLVVGSIAGGIPSDPKVAEGWLRTKMGIDKDADIQALVAEVMVERSISLDAATEIVNDRKHLNGFKRARCADCPPEGSTCRTGSHPLYIEGRQLKAALKEAANINVQGGKLKPRGWGTTNKGLLGYLSEHIFVVEDKLPLGVFNEAQKGQPAEKFHTEPTGVNQRFVHTFRGSGIQYEEYVENAVIDFTVISDHAFKREEWGLIWLVGEQNGVGSSRSQGWGRYDVSRWDAV